MLLVHIHPCVRGDLDHKIEPDVSKGIREACQEAGRDDPRPVMLQVDNGCQRERGCSTSAT